MAKEVKDISFEEEVIKSKIPVLVDFWAEWCRPCEMLAPILDEISKELDGKVKILKMNIDENPNTPTAYGVRNIPNMILFKNGKKIGDPKIGASSKSSILKWINDLV